MATWITQHRTCIGGSEGSRAHSRLGAGWRDSVTEILHQTSITMYKLLGRQDTELRICTQNYVSAQRTMYLNSELYIWTQNYVST